MSLDVDERDPAKTRAQALAELSENPLEATALFRLCESCALLGRTVEAVAACSAGAAVHAHAFDYYHKRARSLGAWRIPPPLDPTDPDQGQRTIARLSNPTRAEFASYVQRRTPVVVSAGGRHEAFAWTWASLLACATRAGTGRSAGNVSLSATGCVPDYGSNFESVRQVDMSLEELLRRVSTPAGCEAPSAPSSPPTSGSRGRIPLTVLERGETTTARSVDHKTPTGCARHRVRCAHAPHRRAGGPPGSSSPLAGDASSSADDEFVAARRHLKLYSYGQQWMLQQHPWLRALARDARPSFLDEADFGKAAEAERGAESGAAAGEEEKDDAGEEEKDDGCVCWISSAGCLTPLHYDLNDGLLVQMSGHKTIWLYEWADRAKLSLRCTMREPGINNWERQSAAELHGAFGREAFPAVQAATRWTAELGQGECLFLPAGWLHEVHSRTASFSLGWRFVLEERDEQALRAAVAKHRAGGGGTHPDTLAALQALGRLLQQQKRPDEAADAFEEALAGLEATRGDGHPETLAALSNLALARGFEGRLAESEELLTTALSGLRAVYGVQHHHTQLAMENLAQLLRMRGGREANAAAAALLRELVEARAATLGKGHPATARATQLLAELGAQGVGDERPSE